MSANERIPGVGELSDMVHGPVKREKSQTIEMLQNQYLGALAMAIDRRDQDAITQFETALNDLYDARPDLRPEATE